MAFIKDLNHDEIRNGWLVTSDTKKVWSRQLEIWQEVDRICRKHGITYWAIYGSLLGAVRHGGFIPWDDDFDLALLRPEYDRFCAVLNDEINGDLFEIKRKTFARILISHRQTTVLESNYGDGNNSPQGIAIDIFALDIAPDGTPESLDAFHTIHEVMAATWDISKLTTETHVKDDGQPVLSFETLQKIAAMDISDRFDVLYQYAYGLWDKSTAVENFDEVLIKPDKVNMQKNWFRETVYLPFESVELPAPIDYEKILTAYYGDWRTPVQDKKNRLGLFHSADIPWREFFRLMPVQKILDDYNRRNRK